MAGRELFGEEEKKEVMDVLETGILFRYGHEAERKDHWKARDLEAEVTKYTGANYAHAISSGSTAVATAMAAAGIGYGDEVICTPFTFLATIEEAFYAGALPVFAEIDETLCLSAEGIEKAISPKTKAVVLVHMCGAAADMDSIIEVCNKHNLLLLEDCGQALGAWYKGKHVGLFGTGGGFSFDFFKITTCGEGGVYITNDKTAYETASWYSDHGHTHEGNNRGMEPHHIMGRNFRLSELNAAIGLAQMRKIETIRNINRENKAVFKEVMEQIPELSFRHIPDPDGDSGTFLNFFLPTQELAEKAVNKMKSEGLGGFDYWYKNMYHFINQWDHVKNMKAPQKLAIHEFGAPQDYQNLHLPKSQEVIGRLISFGIKAAWSKEETQAYAEKIAKAYFEGKSLPDQLPLEGKDKLIFINVDEYEPKTEQIDALRDELLAYNGLPSGLVGIGGGSVMDIAKAVSTQWFYTGMDTYIHDEESKSGIFYNTFAAAYGDKSLELCEEIFLGPNAGQNPENDEKLMIASLFGGLSLTYSEVGVCHALSYGLSYVFGDRHGYANCIAFNHLEEYYGDAVKKFKDMVAQHEVPLPQNRAANWTEEEILKMSEVAYNLPHMWHHALGEDWKNKISIPQIADLYRRM
ncbi:unnamed protein product [Cyprideis torosa]|uniref:Fe-containing alcohol dehydrogenase-like C-terminal domain-containing protein n=1 Tax=Cyprideis torosa TaxID=163714 RepID=A0A7R8WIF0_9CRUS|nr:unnamed protein product [Cyprideis torosa]CAG0900665.1 unnamed protein product [Cyprideis torosa]